MTKDIVVPFLVAVLTLLLFGLMMGTCGWATQDGCSSSWKKPQNLPVWCNR